MIVPLEIIRPWFAVKTEPAKEGLVNRAIGKMVETFLATEIRSYRPTNKTRRRICVEVVLIPRIVFALVPPPQIDVVSGLRYVTGIIRDSWERPLAIPDVQMRTFMAYHAEWLERERKRQEQGKPGPKRKRKYQKFEPDTLQSIAKELFGVEDIMLPLRAVA